MDNSTYTEGILLDMEEMIRYDVYSGIDKNITEYMIVALENLKRR